MGGSFKYIITNRAIHCVITCISISNRAIHCLITCKFIFGPVPLVHLSTLWPVEHRDGYLIEDITLWTAAGPAVKDWKDPTRELVFVEVIDC